MNAQPRPPALIIEDDPDVRDSLIESLQDEGYAAIGVPGGAAALRWLREGGTRPAVILLDLMMPEMNGQQFREEQLKDPALAGIPVILLSADPAIQQKAASLGAAAFLPKPVKLQALLEATRSFMAR